MIRKIFSFEIYDIASMINDFVDVRYENIASTEIPAVKRCDFRWP